MTLNWKKLHVLTVFTVKMDETLKLLNALRINQEHIAAQMNIQLPLVIPDQGNVSNAEAKDVKGL